MSTVVSAVKSQFSESDRVRGIDYAVDQRVRIHQIGDQAVRAQARGRREVVYHLLLDLSETKRGKLNMYCTCPGFAEAGTCKHMFALIQLTDSITGLNLANSNLTVARCEKTFNVQIGKSIQRRAQPQSTHWLDGLTRLTSIRKTATATPKNEKPLLRPSDRLLYVVDVSEMADSGWFIIELLLETPKHGGRGLQHIRIKHRQKNFASLHSPEDKLILTLLSAAHATGEEGYDRRMHDSSYLDDDYDDEEFDDEDFDDEADLSLTLTPAIVDQTLQALCKSGRFYWTLDLNSPELFRPVAWEDKKWELILIVAAAGNDHFTITGQLRERCNANDAQQSSAPPVYRSLSDVVAVCQSGAVLFQDAAAAIAEQDASILNACREIGDLTVSADELPAFLSRIAAVIPPEQLELPAGLSSGIVVGEPRCRLLLRQARHYSADTRLEAEIEMLYGSELLPIDNSDSKVVWDAESKSFIQRDLKREQELRECIAAHPLVDVLFLYGNKSYMVSRKDVPELVKQLAAQEIEVFADGKLQRNSASYSMSVSSGEDWFDLETDMSFGDIKVSLPTLLAAIRDGQRVVRLDDGSEGMLPEQWLKRFRGMAELGTEQDGKLRFRPSQALMLDAWLDDQPVKLDFNYTEWIRKLNDFKGIKAQQEPVSFEGELRHYQRDALGWFKFLEEFRLGGCLADDMGLGKTVQVLALLERRRLQLRALREPVKPSIAVVPKSLVYNWVAEAAKFTPELKVIDYTGPQRKLAIDELEQANLIVTTYATFRIDVETLKDIEFDYAILDEAQAIKNPNCQSTKAVRLIKSDYRLAMTGTPIENHLGDLWSILNFLNPGMLGRLKPTYFARTADDPEANDRLESLGRALKPFILRRTKAQVLTELPEKSEQILYCDMTPKQKKYYQELKTYYAQNLKKKVAEVGLKRAKIHVLEALLRLRQVACDPRLVAPTQRASGAKINMLVEQLAELMSEGHKALVFSQFTSMLDLVRKELNKRKWKYEYLDGKSTKRGEIVRRFQEDPKCQLFLISLKAGGHGLNLTAADYVYILDPWWNPAVEAQAVDRAHRMGQQKPVMAYRMIARDTVEEKIAHMQQSKKKLAEAVISSDESLLQNLSMEDLRALFE